MNEKSERTNGTEKPWYYHKWVWFIIALPASVVVASLITVVIAFNHAPEVIVKQDRFGGSIESSQRENK